MSLTKPIPKKLREEMEADPYYKRCCVTGVRGGPGVKIDWHHNFETYMHGNRGRLNEKWCILPILKSVHDQVGRRYIKEYLDWIMLNRADEATLKKYSKVVDLVAKRDRLNQIYADEKNHPVL